MRVALYLERARECSELADQAPANDKKAILEIAEAWLKLADAAAKEKRKTKRKPASGKAEVARPRGRNARRRRGSMKVFKSWPLSHYALLGPVSPRSVARHHRVPFGE